MVPADAETARHVKRVMNIRKVPLRKELTYTEKWSQDRLTKYRSQGDPSADACVRELVRRKGRLANIFDLLNEIKELRAEEPIFEKFLVDAWTVPEWMDFKRAAKGQRMIAVYGPLMGLGLFTGSLVGGGVFIKQAIVVSLSGQLSGSASTKRVEETAYLIGKMVLPGGLEPGGESHETLVRVRLLHAALRYHLVETGKFKHDTEVPINQHDLAITNGLFGYMNIRSLRQLNINLTDEQVDSWIFMWRYAGHLLGIQDELLPRSLLDQSEFMMASLLHQARPESLNPASKNVLNGVADQISKDTNHWIPERLLRRYMHQITRYLSGNEFVTAMEIEDEGDWYWGIVATRLAGTITSAIAKFPLLGEPLLYHLNMLHMNRFFRQKGLEKAGHRPKL